jgi:hypothetical protein
MAKLNSAFSWQQLIEPIWAARGLGGEALWLWQESNLNQQEVALQ